MKNRTESFDSSAGKIFFSITMEKPLGTLQSLLKLVLQNIPSIVLHFFF